VIKPLSNFDIIEICKQMKIKNFKGVFMRDEINASVVPSNVNANECMIINIDYSRNEGTHWTCLFIENGVSYYFDAFGLAPPVEVIKYCIARTASVSADNRDGETRLFNSFPIQKPNEVICGHYSIYVLFRLSNFGVKFFDVLDELYNYSKSLKNYNL